MVPNAGVSVLRRAFLSRGGPICPEAGLSVPRRVYVPWRAYLSRGGPFCPEAGLSAPRRACLSLGGPICALSDDTDCSRGGFIYPRGGPIPRHS